MQHIFSTDLFVFDIWRNIIVKQKFNVVSLKMQHIFRTDIFVFDIWRNLLVKNSVSDVSFMGVAIIHTQGMFNDIVIIYIFDLASFVCGDKTSNVSIKLIFKLLFTGIVLTTCTSHDQMLWTYMINDRWICSWCAGILIMECLWNSYQTMAVRSSILLTLIWNTLGSKHFDYEMSVKFIPDYGSQKFNTINLNMKHIR